MGFYDKKIQYLDLWEYGEKVCNAGFVKMEVRENECRVWISTKQIYSTEVVIGKMYLWSKGQMSLADQIILHQGIGTYAAKWETGNLAGTEITYGELDGVRIELSEHRYIEKMWEKSEESELEASRPEVSRVEAQKETKQATAKQTPSLPKEKGPQDAVSQETVRQEDTPPEMVQQEMDRMPTTKWELLGQYYKKKIPFGDDKEFLCITPEDLILLPEKYEHLFKNSFLLHGYYAYGHLLLGAIAMQNRNIYRLYIPGVGHEKEQIVAGLFGFGNFMPVNEYYGYYYMTVEL